MKRYVRSSKELQFEVREGLGKNPNCIYLENRHGIGDEISLGSLNYTSVGENRKDLPLTDAHMIEHYTEDFTLLGVGGIPYIVTREVVLMDTTAKPRFKSKIVKVQSV